MGVILTRSNKLPWHCWWNNKTGYYYTGPDYFRTVSSGLAESTQESYKLSAARQSKITISKTIRCGEADNDRVAG